MTNDDNLDDALQRLGLEAWVADGRLSMEWRGIPVAVSTRFFQRIPFPGLAASIEARMVDRIAGQLRINGVSYDLRAKVDQPIELR